MKRLALIGLLATVGIAAIPATSFAQNVDAGCPRAYYRTVDGCVPNTQGFFGPRYQDESNTAPRYYREAPSGYDMPRYYPQRRYYVEPDVY